jgi:hypothetical protein
MNHGDDVFTAEQRVALSIRTVNELIADAEAGSLLLNEELAEVIAGCIRYTEASQLRTLKRLLDQRAIERPSTTST